MKKSIKIYQKIKLFRSKIPAQSKNKNNRSIPGRHLTVESQQWKHYLPRVLFNCWKSTVKTLSSPGPYYQLWTHLANPAGINLFKVNNENRTTCEICSQVTIKTLKQLQCRHSGVFIVNVEHISHIVLVFSLLASNKLMSTGFAKCVQSW